MKFYKLLIYFFLVHLLTFAQDGEELIRIHTVADITAMNNTILPARGNLIYVQSEEQIYYYDGSTWQPISSNSSSSRNWELSGNSISSNDFIGTTNNEDFRIRTNDNQRMVIKNDGKVGVNLSETEAAFEVATANTNRVIPKLQSNIHSTVTLSGSSSNPPASDYWHAFDSLNSTYWQSSLQVNVNPAILNMAFNTPQMIIGYQITAGGNLSHPPYNFELQASNDNTNWTTLSTVFEDEWAMFDHTEQTITYTFTNNNSYEFYQLVITGANSPGDYSIPGEPVHRVFIKEFNLLSTKNFVVNIDGKVGIGTNNPTEKLHVMGNILASGTITPDYVFEHYFDGKSEFNPNYKFLTLEESIEYAKKHKHLPGIPSAKDIQSQGGILINKAVEQNLEKIEELYLYLYEAQQKVKQLKKKVKETH